MGTFPEDTKTDSNTIATFLSFGWVHLTGLSEKLCLIFGKINFRVQTKSKATTQQCTLVKKNILPTGCISKHKLQTANYRKDIVMYFYFIQLPNVMQEKYQVIPDSDLSPEFLSQFKTEADVSKTITHRLQNSNSNLNSQLNLQIFKPQAFRYNFPGHIHFGINFRT